MFFMFVLFNIFFIFVAYAESLCFIMNRINFTYIQINFTLT